jgi:hypothetical protein
MYLFEDQESKEIHIECKLCLAKFSFVISEEEYKEIENFPFKKEYVHGDPSHKLIVFINKNLEVENFEIEDASKQEISYSEELTRQVLSEIDLNEEEIELYFKTTGRDAVSLGEIALLMDKPQDECMSIAEKFVKKGLFKKIISGTPHFSALPPYAALVSQLQKFHFYISDIKSSVPPQLNESFSQLEAKAEGVKKLQDYTNYMVNIKENMLSKISSQREKLDSSVSEIERIKSITSDIENLGSSVKDVMDNQIEEVSGQFKSLQEKISTGIGQQIKGLTEDVDDINVKVAEGVNLQIDELNREFKNIDSKISEIIQNQVVDLTMQFKTMQNKISSNLQKLQLGVLQQAVDISIEKIFIIWLETISTKFFEHLKKIHQITNDGLVKMTLGLRRQAKLIDKTSKDGLVRTSIGLKRQVNQIEMISKEALDEITSKFNNLVNTKLTELIENTVNNIDGITTSTSKSGEEIMGIFNEISEDFNQVIINAEEKVSGISDDVLNSFKDMKLMFSTKVMDTLVNVLNNILERLQISESTTSEFWEKARKSTLFTMKDIWFIRSAEGAKAQINEALSRVKARMLIIAPQLTDIDVEPIKRCSDRVNIRIATKIDRSLPEHKSILDEFEGRDNITLKHREKQDLWGLNKDYEETIVCILSQRSSGREMVGIGSVIEEHIKIFVPILEDAWLSAEKFRKRSDFR